MYDAIVSTHSRLKAAGTASCDTGQPEPVSTHSRLKAAGQCYIAVRLTHCRFNTQPPKGGWHLLVVFDWRYSGFNTQPPEGGWFGSKLPDASRCCFNTQPPEGGWSLSQKPCSIRFRSPDFAKLLRKARTRV